MNKSIPILLISTGSIVFLASVVLVIYYAVKIVSLHPSGSSSSGHTSGSTSSSGAASSSTSSGPIEGTLPANGSTIKIFAEGSSLETSGILNSFGSYLHVPSNTNTDFDQWTFTLTEQISETQAKYRMQNTNLANPQWTIDSDDSLLLNYADSGDSQVWTITAVGGASKWGNTGVFRIESHENLFLTYDSESIYSNFTTAPQKDSKDQLFSFQIL